MDIYTHGHTEAVLRSHRWRTVENSAAYLLPHLRPGQRLLDAGCGPGTITCDLADRVAPGEVVGFDAAADAVAAAQAEAEARGTPNVTFRSDDIYDLDAADDSFDVVHAHQVLQHLTDPVAALRELRRVCAPDGVVAVRDSDYATFTWVPSDERLVRWLDVYHQVAAHNGAEADAGRHLKRWAQEAGFADVTFSSSTWTYSGPEDRAWWGGLWADRVSLADSALHQQAIEYGFATAGELDDLAVAFRAWAEHDDAVFIVVHGEVLARG